MGPHLVTEYIITQRLDILNQLIYYPEGCARSGVVLLDLGEGVLLAPEKGGLYGKRAMAGACTEWQ